MWIKQKAINANINKRRGYYQHPLYFT